MPRASLLVLVLWTTWSSACLMLHSTSKHTDAQSLGQILQDLSHADHEQEVPCRQESRLKWQLILGQSANLLSSTAQPSGETGSVGCAAKCIRGTHMLLLFMWAATHLGSMSVLLIAACD